MPNAPEQPQSISTLIGDLKQARSTSLPGATIDDPQSPTYRAMEDLTTRLDLLASGAQGIKSKKSAEITHPHNFQDITWSFNGEIAPGGRSKSYERTKYDSDKTQGPAYEEEARKALESSDRPYLRSIVFNGGYVQGKTLTYEKKTPDELNLLATLLGKAEYGKSTTQNEQNTGNIVSGALQILRAEWVGGAKNESRISWSGLSAARNHDTTARLIIDRVQKMRTAQYSEMREVTQRDADAIILGALACGDITTALQLAEKSKDIVSSKKEVGDPQSTLKRLFGNWGDVAKFDESICKFAIDRYPTSLQIGAYASLASIGEGDLAGLQDIREAKTLKEIGRTKLKEILNSKRDAWIARQQVVPAEQVAELMKDTYIADRVKKIIDMEGNKQDLDEQILERAQLVAGGEAANRVAGELIRRLNPELSLEEQMKLSVGEAQSGVNSSYQYADINHFSELGYYIGKYGDAFDLTKGTAAEKTAKVRQYGWEQRRSPVTQYLANPSEQNGLAELIMFLNNPTNYQSTIDYTIQEEDRRRRDLTNYKKGLTVLGSRLARGVAFLDTVSHDPEVKKILEDQFGFGALIAPENLEKAQKTLADWFQYTESGYYPDTHRAVSDPNNPSQPIIQDVSPTLRDRSGENLSQYEKFQVEDQPDEDETKAGMLGNMVATKKAELAAQGTSQAVTVLQSERVTAQTTLQAKKDELEQVVRPDIATKTQTTANLEMLRTQLDGLNLQSFCVVDGAMAKGKEVISRRLGRSKDSREIVTQVELDARIMPLKASIATTEAVIAQNETRLQRIARLEGNG